MDFAFCSFSVVFLCLQQKQQCQILNSRGLGPSYCSWIMIMICDLILRKSLPQNVTTDPIWPQATTHGSCWLAPQTNTSPFSALWPHLCISEKTSLGNYPFDKNSKVKCARWGAILGWVKSSWVRTGEVKVRWKECFGLWGHSTTSVDSHRWSDAAETPRYCTNPLLTPFFIRAWDR